MSFVTGEPEHTEATTKARLSGPAASVTTYAFGHFTLDLQRGCLLREGQDIKLRPKSFQLLAYLVENPGRLITKDELMKAVWPDSFVIDDSIVQCVKEIRRAMQDDSQERIKTVPRRGYIFDTLVSSNGEANGSVHNLPPEDSLTSVVKETVQTPGAETDQPLAGRVTLARRRRLLLGAALSALATVFGFVGFYSQSDNAPPVWRAVPLTSYPGMERHPALSPDGNSVAFSWNGDKEDNDDIYILQIGGAHPPQRLTTDPASDTNPAWSPDGRTVSFLRSKDHQSWLVLVPAAGGQEHELAEIHNRRLGAFERPHERMAWTPNGNWIAVGDRENGEASRPDSLLLISVFTGEKRVLIRPSANHTDEKPAFSPNGRALVFVRRASASASDLYLQALSKDYVPAGEPKRLTHEGRADHPVWTPDGDRILYTQGSETRMISNSASGRSQRVILENTGAAEFSLGRDLVYTATSDSQGDIYYAEIPPAGSPAASTRVLISSTRADQQPAFSHDGRQIAFVSERSGSRELWIANADGSNPLQRTSLGAVWAPSWSPDGLRVVFHARPDGQATADLFTIPAAGGAIKRLTTHEVNDSLPSYSRDGRWIYFNSARSGQGEIWKMPADGGEATRVTVGGGWMAVESPDEQTLFYAHPDEEKGIWKMPVRGGEAEQVIGPSQPNPSFAVSKHGIYHAKFKQVIEFLDFSTGKSHPVVVLDQRIGMGLSLSPDGRSLIFTQREQVGSDLMLIRDFSPR